MTNKLADAQVALLRSGLQRADQCVVAPTGKGPGAKKSAARMVEAGWLKEIKAKAGAPVWRTDEDIGATYSLKLTAAVRRDNQDENPATIRMRMRRCWGDEGRA